MYMHISNVFAFFKFLYMSNGCLSWTIYLVSYRIQVTVTVEGGEFFPAGDHIL